MGVPECARVMNSPRGERGPHGAFSGRDYHGFQTPWGKLVRQSILKRECGAFNYNSTRNTKTPRSVRDIFWKAFLSRSFSTSVLSLRGCSRLFVKIKNQKLYYYLIINFWFNYTLKW